MHPKQILKSLGITARKGLGQSFLVGRSLVPAIVEAADISPQDTVVEVGPGLAVLTDELAKAAAAVVAVELDPRLAEYLRGRFVANERVVIVEADILRTDVEELLRQAAGVLGVPDGSIPPYLVVANLPYYITSAVLRHFLEARHRPRRAVVMVQKEVAERIVARPPEMSILSVAVQLYGRAQLVAGAPPGAFYPPPKVSSAVVRIDVHPELPAGIDSDRFFDVVQAGFGQRRKTLVNSLSSGLGLEKEKVAPVLESAGIQPDRRAQTLSVEDWIRLYRHLSDAGWGATLC